MNSMAIELHKNKSKDLNVLCKSAALQLNKAKLGSFDHLWNQPQNFVEPANIRRNGWSGVSILRLRNEQGESEVFFLKRQENQSRYSLRYLTGAPTFRYEADALCLAHQEDWPSVELVAFGSRVNADNGAMQALLVTRALEDTCMLEWEDQGVDWNAHLPQLRYAGEQILQIHQSGWQHGALFPAHLFINLKSGKIHLIDFERARKRLSPQWAAYADFTQFIRRCDWLPDAALNALLASHAVHMPRLIDRLKARFPHRFQ